MSYATLRNMIRRRSDLLIECPVSVGPLIAAMQQARKRGYLNRSEFLRICYLKSPRRYGDAARCRQGDIQKVTRLAYLLDDEEIRIGVLRSLPGVDTPTASCLLGWVDPKNYGVIDWRCWNVLHRFKCVTRNPEGRGLQASHWLEYITIIRKLAHGLGTTPRLIDRWMYSYSIERKYPRKGGQP